MRKIFYEWDVETIDPDTEEVLDHNHRTKLTDLGKLDENEVLVLVRDYILPDGGLVRTWAYCEGNHIGLFFRDSSGIETTRVPKRFLREFRQWSNRTERKPQQ